MTSSTVKHGRVLLLFEVKRQANLFGPTRETCQLHAQRRAQFECLSSSLTRDTSGRLAIWLFHLTPHQVLDMQEKQHALCIVDLPPTPNRRSSFTAALVCVFHLPSNFAFPPSAPRTGLQILCGILYRNLDDWKKGRGWAHHILQSECG